MEKPDGRSKKRLRPLIEDMLNRNLFVECGLKWINNEKTVFQLPWKIHKKSREGDDDAKVIAYVAKSMWPDKPDLKQWKELFRNALRSVEDFEEIKEQVSRNRDYKVYKMMAIRPRKCKPNKKASLKQKGKRYRAHLTKSDEEEEDITPKRKSKRLRADHKRSPLREVHTEATQCDKDSSFETTVLETVLDQEKSNSLNSSTETVILNENQKNSLPENETTKNNFPPTDLDDQILTLPIENHPNTDIKAGTSSSPCFNYHDSSKIEKKNPYFVQNYGESSPNQSLLPNFDSIFDDDSRNGMDQVTFPVPESLSAFFPDKTIRLPSNLTNKPSKLHSCLDANTGGQMKQEAERDNSPFYEGSQNVDSQFVILSEHLAPENIKPEHINSSYEEPQHVAPLYVASEHNDVNLLGQQILETLDDIDINRPNYSNPQLNELETNWQTGREVNVETQYVESRDIELSQVGAKNDTGSESQYLVLDFIPLDQTLLQYFETGLSVTTDGQNEDQVSTVVHGLLVEVFCFGNSVFTERIYDDKFTLLPEGIVAGPEADLGRQIQLKSFELCDLRTASSENPFHLFNVLWNEMSNGITFSVENENIYAKRRCDLEVAAKVPGASEVVHLARNERTECFNFKSWFIPSLNACRDYTKSNLYPVRPNLPSNKCRFTFGCRGPFDDNKFGPIDIYITHMEAGVMLSEIQDTFVL